MSARLNFHLYSNRTAIYQNDANGNLYQFFLNLPFGEIEERDSPTLKNNKKSCRQSMAEQRRSGSFNNPYKFNGKELDEETGLYYYGARYYNPRTSVFISVDPLTEQTMTPYQYTYQNPVRYIDPDGKAPQDIIVLNVDGSIRKVYNDGSPHITIIDPNYKGRFTLSSYRIDKGFIYRNNRNRQIITNIAAYYGQQIGVSGVGATSKGKGMAHFDPSDNGIWILPQSNGSPSSQLNNKYNMQNVLIHENFHKKNEKDGINETFLTHAQVVLKASEHSTFKNTTTDYKEGQIGYMSQLLMNAYYQNKEKEDVQSVIDHFNNLNTGYKLKFYRNDQTIYITTPQGDYKHIKYKRSNSSPNLD